MRLCFKSIAMIMILLLVPISPMSVHAKSVISASDIDIFPAGKFDDSTLWEISSTDGYTENSAQFTTPMIEDGMLSFTHTREQTLQTSLIWSSDSSTNSNYSKGEPDGWYTYSSGLDIKLSGFDVSAYEQYELEAVSVVIAFEIPDQLGDDTVEFSVNWDGQFEQFKTFNTPQTPANYMLDPYYTISLDNIDDWSWQDLSVLEFNLNYESMAPDDSQLNVDALGLKVTWQSPAYGFETAKAVNTTFIEKSPLILIDMDKGATENITVSPCGMEISSGHTEGHWISDVIELPPQQTWGRVNVSGIWTGEVHAKSTDSQDWSYLGEDILGESEFYQIKIVIYSGCLENVVVGINEPRLYIEGEVLGTSGGLDHSLSWLRISIDNKLIFEHKLSELGPFASYIPIEEFLIFEDEGGINNLEGNLNVGVGARFQWDSNGSAETTVVVVNNIILLGGYEIEWDEDPVCSELPDLTGDDALSEDGGGILIPFLDTCSDDYTNDVIINASSAKDFLNVEVESEYLKIYPQQNGFGIDTVSVVVSDSSGNTWTDSFDVEVIAVEDSPIAIGIPDEIWLEVEELREYELTILDVDTDMSNLSISSSHSWVSLSLLNDQEVNNAILSIKPINFGTFSVDIEISDGTSSPYSKTIIIVSSMMADLFVESVEVNTADGTINVGDVVNIAVTVGNSGGITADIVKIRCFVNDIVVNEETIPSLESGKYSTIECTKKVDQSNLQRMELRVMLDYSRDISETSEENNEYYTSIAVNEIDIDSEYSSSDSEEFVLNQAHITLITLFTLIVLLALLVLGPKKIKRI